MATTTVDSSIQPNSRECIDEVIENTARPQTTAFKEGNYTLVIFQSSLNLLAHILIGAVVGVSLIYSFANGLPLGATQLHIVLCVIGVSRIIFFFCNLKIKIGQI